MRTFALAILLAAVAPAAIADERPGYEITCFSGGRATFHGHPGADAPVTFGLGSAVFFDEVTRRMVRCNGDSVATWPVPAR